MYLYDRVAEDLMEDERSQEAVAAHCSLHGAAAVVQPHGQVRGHQHPLTLGKSGFLQAHTQVTALLSYTLAKKHPSRSRFTCSQMNCPPSLSESQKSDPCWTLISVSMKMEVRSSWRRWGEERCRVWTRSLQHGEISTLLVWVPWLGLCEHGRVSILTLWLRVFPLCMYRGMYNGSTILDMLSLLQCTALFEMLPEGEGKNSIATKARDRNTAWVSAWHTGFYVSFSLECRALYLCQVSPHRQQWHRHGCQQWECWPSYGAAQELALAVVGCYSEHVLLVGLQPTHPQHTLTGCCWYLQR